VVIVGDVLERLTNGVLRATPHRVKLTEHTRNSIIRFNALHPDAIVAPLPAFVSDDRPAAYTPVTMRNHMETTIRNLEKGIPAWDNEQNVSRTATYVY
jgi:isopenicillin N synthase-like dioxygenase